MPVASTLFDEPQHPYTVGLLHSLPRAGQDRLVPIPGRPPNMLSPPAGCAFRARCPHVAPVCATKLPELEPYAHSLTACVRIKEIDVEMMTGVSA